MTSSYRRFVVSFAALGGLLGLGIGCSSSGDEPLTCNCGYLPPTVFVIASSCDPTTSVHDYTLSGTCVLFEDAVTPSGAGTCTVTLADGASASVPTTASVSTCCGTYYDVGSPSDLVGVPDAGSVGDTEFDRGVQLHELVIPDTACANGDAG